MKLRCILSRRSMVNNMIEEFFPEEINLCPACINDFIAKNGLDKLGSEAEDLRIKNIKDVRYVTKLLCREHQDRNQFEEMRKALEATR